jgi:hypothetical protein
MQRGCLPPALFSRRSVLPLLAFAAMCRMASADCGTPGDLVAAIYRAAAGPGGNYDDGTSVIFDPDTRKRFLSKRLRAAIAAMLKRTPKGDAPDLDFDPVVAGNDPSVHDLKIATESAGPTQAVVIADFQSHGDTERTVLRYLLVKEGGAWKVDDIIAIGKDKWQVSKIIAGQCPQC